MPTYTVLKVFTDVNHAKHLVGETIADVSVVPEVLVRSGYLAMVPDAVPDPDWDARMDTAEADIDTLQTESADHEERITTIEAILTIGA